MQTLLNEYALTFNALLEQSVRLDASDWRDLAGAVNLPYMDEDARNSLMAENEQASYDIVEALREKPDDLQSFKDAFNG